MYTCKKCNTKIEDEWKLCPKCGTLVENTDLSTPPEDSFDKTIKRTSDVYGAVRLDNLPEGYIIDGRYEIKRKLGQGGFGAVYLAFDRKMEVEKALKIIPEVVASDRESMKQLQREAKIMVKLNHPNIVRVYDFDDGGEIKYINMEYVDGKTLTDLKLEHRDERLPEVEVMRYAVKIAEAFEYAHNKGILHRDIKPQNVMVTAEGEVKVMDFGIAETVRSSMTRLTGVSSSGTLAYMSPEQLRGKEFGKESDVYSFGTMLYDLLSGHPPFYRGEIYYQILNEQPERIEGVSDWLNTLLQNCLQKDYRDRPGSFSKLLKLLNPDTAERELISETDKSRKKNIHTSGDHQIKNWPSTRVVVAAFILLAVLISIIWYSVEESKRREEITRIEEEQQLEEIRRAEEEARIAEEERRAEEARRIEEQRRSEQARREEDTRRAEEERRAAEARQAEEQLQAEQARREEKTRRAEEERRAAEARRAEEQLQAEQARREEETRRAEEERRAAEARRAEGARRVEVGDVFNSATGKIWMDRNLGANRVATSSTDAQAYGHLYQWGRATDGHQVRTSGTTSRRSSSNTPRHGNFILAPGSPWDWRSPQNDNLWQGVNGINNPCPAGYRLPTAAEWETERRSWRSNDAAGAFASPLKLPVAGYRNNSSGSLYVVGSDGNYWSSTVDGTYSRYLSFLSTSAAMLSNLRASGLSVRCLKDDTSD